jgi:hypothetical protein
MKQHGRDVTECLLSRKTRCALDAFDRTHIIDKSQIRFSCIQANRADGHQLQLEIKHVTSLAHFKSEPTNTHRFLNRTLV